MIRKRLRDLKEDVYLANIELKNRGLVIYTFGNVSGIDRESGIFAIKPSGVDYIDLSPEDMVLVDLDGKVVEGKYRPSSDTRTHLILYREFAKIGGVAHTHSDFATGWAQAVEPIKCYGTTHADYFHGEIPCTRVLSSERTKKDYEIETGRLIVETFRKKDLDPYEIKAVLVGGHGPFTWGKDAGEAVFLSVMLEEVARIALYTKLIDSGAKGIPHSLLDKHYMRKHGRGAYYGQRQG